MSELHQIRTSSYDDFKASIREIPILTKEEELRMTKEYVASRSKTLEDELIYSHLRFASYIVGKYAGYTMPEDDMIQEAIMGLIKGIRKFSPEHNVRLYSFVGYHVRYHLNEYVTKNYRIFNVTTTRAQRKLFFKLKGLKHLSDKEIARELEVLESDVATMRERLLARDEPDIKTGHDSEAKNGVDSSREFLVSKTPSQLEILEDSQKVGDFKEALSSLPDREQYIIKRRFLHGGDKTEHLHVIAKEMGISNERVRQLSVAAIGKMKKFVNKKHRGEYEQFQAA